MIPLLLSDLFSLPPASPTSTSFSFSIVSSFRLRWWWDEKRNVQSGEEHFQVGRRGYGQIPMVIDQSSQGGGRTAYSLSSIAGVCWGRIRFFSLKNLDGFLLDFVGLIFSFFFSYFSASSSPVHTLKSSATPFSLPWALSVYDFCLNMLCGRSFEKLGLSFCWCSVWFHFSCAMCLKNCLKEFYFMKSIVFIPVTLFFLSLASFDSSLIVASTRASVSLRSRPLSSNGAWWASRSLICVPFPLPICEARFISLFVSWCLFCSCYCEIWVLFVLLRDLKS